MRDIGSYTCQIFWKGDPSIENFIIRFTTEDMMKRWAQQLESQRRRYRDSRHGGHMNGGVPGARTSDGSRHGGGTSQTEFSFLQNQPALENPYKEGEEEDDEAETLVGSGQPSWAGSTQYINHDSFSQSRNGSSTSLRSRSATGDSGGPTPTPSLAASARAPPPRFPSGMASGQAPLTLRTQQLQQQAASPGDRVGDSYFSPVGESPMSSRASSSSQGVYNQYPFPRQTPPQNGYYDEGHGATRFTAPAMGGRPGVNGRDGSVSGPSNGYAPPGRSGQAARGMHSAQQMPMQPRNRSASSPDIQGQRVPGTALRNGSQPPVPDVPGVYQQQALAAGHPSMVPRSQSNSPATSIVSGSAPTRGMTSSPASSIHRNQSYQQPRFPPDPSPTATYNSTYDRSAYPPTSTPRTHPPGPLAKPPSAYPSDHPDPPTPTQLKVKVHCPSASQTLTLVVPLNITYQSLKDRIDAKLQRSTNISLSDHRGPKENQVKLKYLDEDDFVSIQSDEDVQTAFEAWREGAWRDGGLDAAAWGAGGVGGLMGEIELFCQR